MITGRRFAAISAGILSIMPAGNTRAWGQEACSAPLGVIEVLPATGFSHSGNTCDFTGNTVSFYDSRTCRIPRVNYPGGDVVYKVRLNAGNEVAFFLDVQGSADLMLALVKICGEGNSCVSSSPDFIGSGDEELSAAKYDPGVYYLYIDAAALNEDGEIACGPYQLTVSGVNPVPDLLLDLASPSRAIAGKTLEYKLKVTNRGTLTATGVVITQTLPQGTKDPNSEDCTTNGMTVQCYIPSLPPGESSTSTVTVKINPATRNLLTSKADVIANEGLSTRDEVTTQVDAESDLSIRLDRSKESVVAGQDSLTYTFTLRNAGPSDATQVKVTDTLAGEEALLKASEGCNRDEASGGRTVVCQIPRIPARGTAERSMTVNVRSSALGRLVNKATVAAVEREPARNRGPNSATIETLVERVTDLKIANIEAKRKDPGPTDSIPAGAEFDYIITVRNLGPSDSSGGTVTVTLPDDLTFLTSASGCTFMIIEEETSKKKLVVTCVGISPAFGGEESVEFTVTTSPALGRTALHGDAVVISMEDPVADTEKLFITDIVVEADLQLDGKAADVGSICAGGNITYTVTVSNAEGPSNSLGGTISDKLVGLSFVSSPDGCSLEGDAVTCQVPPLEVGQKPYSVRFVTTPSATSTLPTTITNIATVTSPEDANSSNNASASVSTTILPQADLALTLNASPDPVATGASLTYTLKVTAQDPSATKDVTVELRLPEDSQLPPPNGNETCAPVVGQEDLVTCTLPLNEPKDFTILAPTIHGKATATATIEAGNCDMPDNNEATVTTAVANSVDADLALTMTADRAVVTEGDSLKYSIVVVNQGIVPAEGVEVEVHLPDGVTFVPGEGCSADIVVPQIVRCAIGRLDANIDVPFTLIVNVDSTAGHRFESNAKVSADPDNDPNMDNNARALLTQRAAALVLPFFEVAEGGSPLGLTTLYSVRNHLDSEVSFRYEYIPTSPQPDPPALILARRATRIVDLRDLAQLRGTTGYVGITPVTVDDIPVDDAQRHTFAGDFIRIDPSQGIASGERLISTDTSRTPPELCQSWSVRFLRGLPEGSSTELLFFVPGNTAGGVVATGRVFADSGAFVQNVEISSDQEAFRVSINARDDGGLPLLASSGSIEWTFRKGLVGNVTTVHKLRAGDEVAVPGFCRAPGHAGARSLILPFFQADSATNTYAAVRNETDDEVQVQVTYSDASGESEQQLPKFPLAAHQTWTVSLRGQNLEKGFMKVEALSGSSESVEALSGNFIRIGPDGLAGSALVETPARLCRTWDVHFIQGRTSFLFFLNAAGTPNGTVYDESGASPGTVPVENRPRSFLVPASDLGLTGNGSVEWDLGVEGFVAMLFTGEGPGGKYSVLIPGTCRDGGPK